MHVILGIDPGSMVTGFGAVAIQGGEVVHIEHGVISPPAGVDYLSRLHIISDQLTALMSRIKPETTVVEKIFLGRNADSAFKLGQVRGICMLAAAQSGSKMVEYATRSVKKGITGNGGATKEQVQLILFSLLGIRGPAKADASDALALAYYHARRLEVELALARQVKREAPL